MNTYDFKTLNDKEFEAFVCDLLGIVANVRIERFKPGRDQGIDGRFFSADGVNILQCKHYANTPISQLIKALERHEKPKLEKLKPARYLLAVSNRLSPADKKRISEVLAPYLFETDIYGAEDLNDLLNANPQVETRHYKLWLNSSSILSTILHAGVHGRSQFNIEEIKRKASNYVVTSNHVKAQRQLEALRVLIVTGEPGIGKTTLAEQLCLQSLAEGYAYVEVSDDIAAVEDVYCEGAKQLFYFDDFLGRNYLDALHGHEGKKITQFIKRVAHDENKRFILTSRSTILNQGKVLIDLFDHERLERNEYELRITSLSSIDKAKILYNHILRAGLEEVYVEKLYDNKKYRVIVSHENFNPRLISYITDPDRLRTVEPDAYWNFVMSSLKDPSAIWSNPFDVQQDDFGRAMALLVVLHRHPVAESDLSKAYADFIGIPTHQNMKGRRDFLTTLKSLTGSLLSRAVSKEGAVTINLFNPAIGDFVLARYAKDVATLGSAFSCINTVSALRTLKGMAATKIVSLDVARTIAAVIAERAGRQLEGGLPVAHVAEIATYVSRVGGNDSKVRNHLALFLKYILGAVTRRDVLHDCMTFVDWGYRHGMCSLEEVTTFLETVGSSVMTEEEIEACYGLLDGIPDHCDRKARIAEEISEKVSETVSANVENYVDVSSCLSDCEPGNYKMAVELISTELESKLASLGFPVDGFSMVDLMSSWDLRGAVDAHFSDDGSYVREDDVMEERAESDIDDIFERENLFTGITMAAT